MMDRIMVCALVVFLAAGSPATAAEDSCPRQAVPPAIDSIGPPRVAQMVIAFSGSPSLQYPARAWVVRAAGRLSQPATLEIVRLRLQRHCNLYDIESRWNASLTAEEFRTAVEAAAPLGTPPADAFTHDNEWRSGEEVVLDGTGIELRLKRMGLEVRRSLNHYDKDGAEISAIFHALVVKHVPASDAPAADWRTLRPVGDAP